MGTRSKIVEAALPLTRKMFREATGCNWIATSPSLRTINRRPCSTGSGGRYL